MADYRGLGFDPTPGSPDAVMAASERCRRAIGLVPEFQHDTEGWWDGVAAGAFSSRLTGTPDQLAEAQQVLRTAADTLDSWAATLLGNQRRTEQLDQRAQRLRHAIRTASDEVDNATTVAQFSTDPSAVAARDNAVARHESLIRQLDDVLDEARLLEHDHLAAAERVAERLRALDTGGVEAAAQVPDRDEQFSGLTSALETQSGFASELASLLRVPGWKTGPPAGAADAFASALTG